MRKSVWSTMHKQIASRGFEKPPTTTTTTASWQCKLIAELHIVQFDDFPWWFLPSNYN